MTTYWSETLIEQEGTHTGKLSECLPLKEVEIKLLKGGKLSVSSFAFNHLKSRDNIIKNVTISALSFDNNTNLTTLKNFMLKKCNPNLRKICIVGDIDLESFGEEIAAVLRKVKTVEFVNRRGAVDEGQFLTHCPNLGKLILGDGINAKNVDAILQKRYRRLTQFHYLYGDGTNLNAEKLQVFFRRNDRIQYIEWKPRMYDECARDHFVKCVKALDHAVHLTHFRLCFADQLPKYSEQNFRSICNQLNLLCQRDSFKFLEIELTNPPYSQRNDKLSTVKRMKSFASWKQLIKIHLNRFGLVDTMPAITELVHLKSIVLESCSWTKETSPGDNSDETNSFNAMNDNPSMEVPHIVEVKLKNLFFDDLTALCKPFVRHWKNLNTIIAPVATYGIKLDIAELSGAREKLTDACELTIITNHKSLPTNQEHDLVKLLCHLNR